MPKVVGSTLSLIGSGRRSIVVATLKIGSDGTDVAVIPRSSRAEAFRQGKRYTFSKTLKEGCATHGPRIKSGPGADVFWSVEWARFSRKHYGF